MSRPKLGTFTGPPAAGEAAAAWANACDANALLTAAILNPSARPRFITWRRFHRLLVASAMSWSIVRSRSNMDWVLLSNDQTSLRNLARTRQVTRPFHAITVELPGTPELAERLNRSRAPVPCQAGS